MLYSLIVPIWTRMRGGQTDEKRVQELTQILYAKLDAYEAILSKRQYLAGDVSHSICQL